MIDLVLARADAVDATTYERLRASLPSDRQRKADAYHRPADRYASVVAFALLQHAWSEKHRGPMPAVTLGRFGKPRFAGDAGWHFNLSHDASICACALAEVPVGVDVQTRVPFDPALFDRMAAPGERGLRRALSRRDDLSELWTRKEAVLKRTGRGLSTPLQSVDTVAALDVLTLTAEDVSFRVSVSAEGVRADDLLARLRVRWVRPNVGGAAWGDLPDPVPRPCTDAGAYGDFATTY